MSEEREKPTTSGEDAETARILETAVELQERARAVGTHSAHGLTVEDLRQIAQEVGVDPRFVDIAVSDVQGPVERHKSALAGGPVGWRFHSEVVGEIDDDDRGQILQAVRSVMGAKGEFADIYGRMGVDS